MRTILNTTITNISSVDTSIAQTALAGGGNNIECNPPEFWMRLMSVSAGIVVIIVGGIGNITTLVSIAAVRPLWRFSNINIFLLAICDLFTTTYICGHTIEKLWNGCWSYSLLYCRIFNSINAVFYFASLALLALVSYDRYLMVSYGASYAMKENRYTVITRTSVIMIIVVIFTIPAVNLHWFTGVTINSEHRLCVVEVLQSATYYLILNFGGTFLPVGVMLFCYLSVLRYRPWKEIAQSAEAAASTTATTVVVTTAQLTMRRRASLLIKTLFILLLVTNALYFFTTIIVSMFAAGYLLTLNTTWWLNLYLSSYPVAWINNAFNPILYVHAMPDFQRAAETIWQKIYTTVRASLVRPKCCAALQKQQESDGKQ